VYDSPAADVESTSVPGRNGDIITENAHWNMKRSYRLAGKSFLEQNLVSFPISDAIPIENGKMLDEAVSPTVAHVGQKPAHRKTIPVRQ